MNAWLRELSQSTSWNLWVKQSDKFIETQYILRSLCTLVNSFLLGRLQTAVTLFMLAGRLLVTKVKLLIPMMNVLQCSEQHWGPGICHGRKPVDGRPRVEFFCECATKQYVCMSSWRVMPYACRVYVYVNKCEATRTEPKKHRLTQLGQGEH